MTIGFEIPEYLAIFEIKEDIKLIIFLGVPLILGPFMVTCRVASIAMAKAKNNSQNIIRYLATFFIVNNGSYKVITFGRMNFKQFSTASSIDRTSESISMSG